MLVLFAMSCGGSVTESAQTSTEVDRLRLTMPVDRDDGVGTFTSVPWGFETNSFWIEGPTGVVVIDTQFLPSEARHAIRTIEQETNKRVVLAIVLHPNPDKFNGADVFREHGARVITSEQVLAHVPEVAAIRRRAFLARYAPDYPDHDPTLEAFGSATVRIHDAGLDLTLHVLGAGCSAAHVVAEWNGHVFTGDLVTSQTHAWLELGYVREWLQRIEEIRALSPRRVHPGRGPSGGADLLDATSTYLTRVLELVAGANPSMPPPEGAVDDLRAAVMREFPSHGYPVFLYGLSRVWEREALRRSSSE